MHRLTVICPFFRGEEFLGSFTKALSNQRCHNSEYEVLIVDNSSVQTVGKSQLPSVFEVIHAPERQSSYYARNVGIDHSRGDVIAFIDIDCQALPDWLANGVKTLTESGKRIVAGRVEMESQYSRSVWHYFDAIYNINNERSVSRGFAKTANLLVPKKAFHDIGLFDSARISGGDVEWTKRAVAAGYELVYDPTAIVVHPTRGMVGQLKKQLRVGGGRSVGTDVVPIAESYKTRIAANLRYVDGVARRDGKSAWFCTRLRVVYLVQLMASIIGTIMARFGIRFNW